LLLFDSLSVWCSVQSKQVGTNMERRKRSASGDKVPSSPKRTRRDLDGEEVRGDSDQDQWLLWSQDEQEVCDSIAGPSTAPHMYEANCAANRFAFGEDDEEFRRELIEEADYVNEHCVRWPDEDRPLYDRFAAHTNQIGGHDYMLELIG